MSLIIPEVFAECVNEKLHTGFKMAQLAYDATADVADITVRRQITIGHNSKLNFRLTSIRPRGLTGNCTFLSD